VPSLRFPFFFFLFRMRLAFPFSTSLHHSSHCAPAFVSILPLRACSSPSFLCIAIKCSYLFQIKTKDGSPFFFFPPAMLAPDRIHHPRSEFLSPTHQGLIAGVGLAYSLSALKTNRRTSFISSTCQLSVRSCKIPWHTPSLSIHRIHLSPLPRPVIMLNVHLSST